MVGKLSDMYGRKPFILTGIVIFIVGSFLCGTAHGIIWLIVYRGVQGFGAGMIMSTSFAAIGDLFAPRERGRWQGLMTASFGLASVFGPTLGGYIVDHLEWHWVFWVFLPFGIVTFLMISFLFPKLDRKENAPVDYTGSLLLTLTMVPMLLAFSWAGSKYAWGSAPIIGLLIGSAAALALFILAEKKAANPVLPLHLFKNSIFTISNMAGFMMGAGMFGAIMYMPFFVQGVMGTSATHSGYVTMPMTLSLVLGSMAGGQIISRLGKYKRMALLGLLVMSIGMVLMSFMNTETTVLHAIGNMIVVGLGLGVSMPVFSLTVQNAVEQRLLGVATASAQLFRSLGGTIGVAIMGTVLSHRMIDKMSELSAESGIGSGLSAGLSPDAAARLEELKNPQVLLNPVELEKIHKALPAQLQDVFTALVAMLREALSYALSGVFVTGGVVVGLAFLVTFFLKEIPLRSSAKKPLHPKAEPRTDKPVGEI